MDSVVVKKDEEEDDNEEEKEEKEEVVVVDANQGSDAVAADLSPDSAAMQAAEELVRKERTEEYVRRHLGAQFSSVTVIDHPELVTPEDWRLKLVAYAQRPVTPRHRESRTWTSRLTDESVYPVFRNQTTGEYKCVRCDKKFAKRRMLYRHYGSHDGLLPCPQCGQIFANEDSRQEHYRTAQHEQQPCRKCNLPLDVAAQAAHYIRAHLAFARP